MRVVAIADIHGKLPLIPECDVLLIAGDLAPDFGWDPDLARLRQIEWLKSDYAEWEQQVPAKHILIVPGNHDWFVGLPRGLRSKLFIDEGCEIDGIKFWFSPWIPPVGCWNFMADRERRKQRFNQIPPHVDVLVVHGPPHKVQDVSYSGENCGCPELRSAIWNKKPRFVVFGHIHEGRRQEAVMLGNAVCWNVSVACRGSEPREFEVVPKA